ncbi:MAG: MMPL family transporter [Deltaproteobacteria bacterium]|nr:MMPL family transporter [Deltaproteobacteria bacterium]
MNRTEHIYTKLERYSNFIYKNHNLLIIIFLILFVLSTYVTSKLRLVSDFVELLPEHFKSVSDLKKILERVGGTGNLFIAIESPDVKASQRFADDIVKLLRERYSDKFRYIDYKVDELKDFYEKNAALYMSLEELEDIYNRLNRKITAIKMKNNPLFVDISGSIEEDSKIRFDDIEEKYKKKTESYQKYIDGYYTGEEGRLLAIIAKPTGKSTDMNESKKLLYQLEKDINSLEPQKYHKEIKFAFTGSYKISLEEYETLKKDIFGTALLCLTLIGLIIFVFFRNITTVVLIGINITFAVFLTFAITYFVIGYVNTVTAFMGAIIAGTGINYGIIMLARFYEERRLGNDTQTSLKNSITQTMIGTIGASGTTAIAFGIFLFAEVRSFTQFGFIGLTGIFLAWFYSYTLLPALLVFIEKRFPSRRTGEVFSNEYDIPILPYLNKIKVPFLIVCSIITLLSVYLLIKFIPNALEYDMSNLRTKSSMESGTAVLDHRVSQIMGTSLTPSVILAESIEEGKMICDALYKKKKEQGKNYGINDCKSILSYIPEDQDDKLEIIRDIKKLLKDETINLLNEDDRKKVLDFKKYLNPERIEIENLPEKIKRQYTDKQGEIGKFVYVTPAAGKNLWNATNLFRFTDTIREVKLENGKIVTSSGDAIVFADLLRLIEKDGPISTLASLVGVLLFILLLLRSFKFFILVFSALIFGVAWMLGAIALFDLKLNFFNFVVLPMTFGVAIDYAFNIVQRYKQEGHGSITKVISRVGVAVLLCSLTTQIGYGVLITGDSLALRGFGKIALIGELTCIFNALIVLPALVFLIERKKDAII